MSGTPLAMKEWPSTLHWLRNELRRLSIGAASGEDVPPSIAHYTRTETLQKILETRSFLAGDATTTNDVIEEQYGRTLIGIVLADYMLHQPQTAPVRHLLDFCKFQMEDLAETALGPRYFLASFSDARDDMLSQWRAYGDGGRGIAIELDSLAVCDTDVPGGTSPALYRVVYTEAEQAAAIGSVLAAVKHFADVGLPLDSRVPDPLLITASSIAAAHLTWLRPQLKNKWFESEREWRVVQSVYPGDQIPILRIAARDFVSLRLGSGVRLPISRITLGPICSAGDADKVACLVKEHGYDIEIRRSLIPYRG